MGAWRFLPINQKVSTETKWSACGCAEGRRWTEPSGGRRGGAEKVYEKVRKLTKDYQGRALAFEMTKVVESGSIGDVPRYRVNG
jgi:hypothetical protein